MAEIHLTPELTKFLSNVFRATKRGLIPWEPTAVPGTLIAPLEGEYSLRLEQVSDFSEQSSEPDHVLSLYKGRQPLFQVDRKDASQDEIAETFDPEIKKSAQLFRELWKHAYHAANHISEELDTVNRLLDRKLLERSKSF